MRKLRMTKIEILALAFALSMSLAACGGANTKSAETSAVVETTAAAGAAARGGPRRRARPGRSGA